LLSESLRDHRTHQRRHTEEEGIAVAAPHVHGSPRRDVCAPNSRLLAVCLLASATAAMPHVQIEAT
jgi:hypothetical protein